MVDWYGKLDSMEGQWASENEMLEALVSTARLHNWLVFHDNDPRRNEAGFPDLVIARPDHGVHFLELKTELGRVTEDQNDWGMALGTDTVRPPDMEKWLAHLAQPVRGDDQRPWWEKRMADRALRAEKRKIYKKKRSIINMTATEQSATIQTHMVWPHGTMVRVQGRKGVFKYLGHSTSRSGVEEITMYGPMIRTDDRLVPQARGKYHTVPADKVKQA